MITVPFKMTPELRERFLAARTSPPSEYWPDVDRMYAFTYPSDGFKDSFGISYMIWRDTETDEVTGVTIANNEGPSLIELDVRDGRHLYFGGKPLEQKVD